ncbi:uncharacterized protein LOC107638376 isoform X2 [Arachis ipaensis]|uniref:uncharacterized protein LOC107638376 isoform X2 n=1 Tax=Arachis ipaensis TaxID=130454 RepID=UPI0007AF01A5|nr:uncharacterized protein LOC107638376 isoform X2 [Arachis ipaensis]
MWTVEEVRNRFEIDVCLLLTGNDVLCISLVQVRLTLPKQCELSHFEHTFQYCVFRTSDSKGDMGFQVGDMQGTIPVTLGLSRQHSFLSFVNSCESTKRRRVPCTKHLWHRFEYVSRFLVSVPFITAAMELMIEKKNRKK